MNCGCYHKIPSLWLVEIWFVVVYRDLMKSPLAPLINSLVRTPASKFHMYIGASRSLDKLDKFRGSVG